VVIAGARSHTCSLVVILTAASYICTLST
jgi:hypothetical protein